VVNLTAPLTDRQLQVLRWIGDGCPPGVMDGFSYKTTAIALQGRRLVAVSKKKGIWRADLTDAGKYYLNHGSFRLAGTAAGKEAQYRRVSPPGRKVARGRADLPGRPGFTPPETAQASTNPEPAVAKKANRKLPPTEQLIADIIAAGGELQIHRHTDQTNYELRVASAIRFGKSPTANSWSSITARHGARCGSAWKTHPLG
jgi:hypothetical protein